MTAQEAKQKAETIRKVILDTYRREVQPSPFFNDLRAGNLSQARLQGWIKNWYAFVLEVNTGMATSYHQFVGFFKRHPELENRIAQKIGEEFTTPAIGGHARMLPILGKALGVSADEMIECELIPEARGLVDFFVRSWIDIPLAECFAVHLDEDHGGTNQAILEVALQEGYGNERAGWPLEYCGKIAVQMIGNFYDGVYRRYA